MQMKVVRYECEIKTGLGVPAKTTLIERSPALVKNEGKGALPR